MLSPPSFPPAEEAGGEDPAWGLRDVIRIAVLAVIAIAVFSIAALFIAGSTAGRFSPEFGRDPKVIIPAQLAAYLVVIGFMVVLVRARRREFWGAIRWNWPQTNWVVYAAVGVVLAFGVQSASTLLPIPKSLPIEKYFRDSLSAYLMAAFGVSVAPLVEELFFRGFLYPVLARRLGVAAGVVITAGSFALIHESQLARAWGPLLLLFVVGLILTLVRARTGSVAASFLIHVAYNVTLFSMLYIASDRFRHLERIAS